MKYLRGFLVAALCAALVWALTAFCQTHTALVDMIYPYVSRLIQTTLADWTAGADFLLWQVLAVVLGIMFLASIVLMLIFRWNFVQWVGWVTAGVSLLWTLHTGLYGLNNYAGPLSDDIRLTVSSVPYEATELAEATEWYRDKANEAALKLERNEDGSVIYPSFEEMAAKAGDGFYDLTYKQFYPVFAGSLAPVKKLGWADMYTSMGITGVTMPLTGEAAVNPNIPAMSLPFTMCHEMAHRMCIAFERDANLAAFLACQANPDPIFQYSGYFMAFRYCYNALVSLNTTASASAAQRLLAGCNEYVTADLNSYKAFFAANMDAGASDFAHSVNNAYIQGSGDPSGTNSYNEVSDLLVSWHIQNIYLPDHTDELPQFDPQDKDQVGDD